MKTKKENCQVCGAKVRAFEPYVTTCDALCNRAKKGGRSRAGQIAFEILQEQEQEAWEAHQAELYERNTAGSLDLEHANRPYLGIAYA